MNLLLSEIKKILKGQIIVIFNEKVQIKTDKILSHICGGILYLNLVL